MGKAYVRGFEIDKINQLTYQLQKQEQHKQSITLQRPVRLGNELLVNKIKALLRDCRFNKYRCI